MIIGQICREQWRHGLGPREIGCVVGEMGQDAQWLGAQSTSRPSVCGTTSKNHFMNSASNLKADKPCWFRDSTAT